MIYQERPSPPARLMESGVTQKWHREIVQWAARTAENQRLMPPKIKLPFEERDFGLELEESIFQAFAQKCVFCETVATQEDGKYRFKLLYYRPFPNDRNVRNRQEATHYFWLTWQWPNMYLACSTCHQNYLKNARPFPITSQRAHPIICETYEDLFKVKWLNQTEQPLILDPCYDNPVNHIRYIFRENFVELSGISERGRITISTLQLNREELGSKRRIETDLFEEHVNRILQLALNNGLTQKNVEGLVAECAAQAPFAGMKRYFLQKWLDDHEQETRGGEWQVVRDRLRDWREETAVPPQPYPLPDTSRVSSLKKIVPQVTTEKPRIKLSKSVLRQMPNDDIEQSLKLILKKMYSEVDEVIVETMFDTGFSGAFLFHVLPKKERRSQLPRVVKIDKDHNIASEFENGRKIKDYVSGIIPPISMEKSGLGFSGIQYMLSGDGKTNIMSLKKFLINASLANIQLVFKEELFPTMEQFWSTRQEDHYDWGKYDRILPASIEMEYLPQHDSVAHEITPDILLRKLQLINVGDIVKVSNFKNVQIEINEVIFNLPDQTCRMKMIIPPNTPVEMDNRNLASPLFGKVLHTRNSLLHEKVWNAYLQNGLDAPAANTRLITLPDQVKVSNPLLGVENLLDAFSNVYISDWIHGDLNLENVLVEYDSNQYPKKIALIDFATIREDAHILHDFLRLEASIWLYIVSDEISGKGFEKKISQLFQAASLNEDPISKAFQNLKSLFIIRDIRKQAQPYLHKQKWDDYFRGLTLYMLGALKYDNLDEFETIPSPKILAFWVACLANHYLENGRIEPIPFDDSLHYDSPGGDSHDESVTSISEPSYSELVDKKFLHDEIDAYFELREIRTMCFQLNVIDFENIPGETRKEKVIELIKHCKKVDTIPELLAYCKRERPLRDWNNLRY